MIQARFAVAGTHSGVGKTTIACGLMAALVRRGLTVQPFKVGPDFIDPSFHRAICQRPSINLDSWMMGHDGVRSTFDRWSAGAAAVIVEGVMGMFDGSSGVGGSGSTADAVQTLGLPVVLVVDASHMAGSAAALVHGYASLDKRVSVAAVIANRVGNPKHLQMVKEAVESETGIPVVGGLPRTAELTIPERHLGLVSAEEHTSLSSWTQNLADFIETHLELDQLLGLTMTVGSGTSPGSTSRHSSSVSPAQKAVVAVARDAAFSFYYEENLRALVHAGGVLREFSPLANEPVPESAHAVYLGGGFPEMYGERLSGNERSARSIRQAHQAGMPIYAECGGLAYLCEALEVPREETRFPMVGIVPGRAVLQERLQALGYREAVLQQPSILGPAGTVLRGHEFHYTCWEAPTGREQQGVYALQDSEGRLLGKEGFQNGSLLASYVHVYFPHNLTAARSLVAHAVSYKQTKEAVQHAETE